MCERSAVYVSLLFPLMSERLYVSDCFCSFVYGVSVSFVLAERENTRRVGLSGQSSQGRSRTKFLIRVAIAAASRAFRCVAFECSPQFAEGRF